jgi:hypothetical protein
MHAAHDQAASDGLVRVRFQLEQDDDGWPPARSEGLWAEPLGNDHYRIDNTPWFVRSLAAEDVVEAHADDDGTLWASRVVRHSGRMTVRVIPYRRGPLRGQVDPVLEAFAELGVAGEGAGPRWHVVALDIPPDADHRAILARLRAGAVDGSWAYEEGCVTDEWLAL